MQDHRKISVGLFGIILVLFFFPFADVSCSGQKVATVSGIDLIMGKSFQPLDEKNLNQLSKDIPQNNPNQSIPNIEEEFRKVSDIKVREPFVALAFLAGIAGLIFSFYASSLMLPALAGLVGFILLMFSRYKMDKAVTEEWKGLVQLDYRFGFWLSAAIFIIAAVWNFYMNSQTQKGEED